MNGGTPHVFSLGEAFEKGSYDILDMFDGQMLVSYETPTQIPRLFVVSLDNGSTIIPLARSEEGKTIVTSFLSLTLQSGIRAGKTDLEVYSAPEHHRDVRKHSNLSAK
jgi:hypothetical protein